MSTAEIQEKKVSFITDFKEITKIRLTVIVVFSAIAGYFLGADTIIISELLVLSIGGYSIVGASNAYNQIIEKDLDALMDRTRNRPIPAGRMTTQKALTIAIVLTIIGLSMLYYLNPKTAMFGAISIFCYVSLYTPLKTKTPLSVFVGAIPGAIPFMLGWVAATGNFGIEAGTLFMVQFFWQFPHFWAIGWFLFDDYKKGGFFMLPTGKKDDTTANQIIIYTIWTIACSIIPAFGKTGALSISVVSGIIVFCLGLYMLKEAIVLYKVRTDAAAKKLMLVSVTYISVLQVIYVADKYITEWI